MDFCLFTEKAFRTDRMKTQKPQYYYIRLAIQFNNIVNSSVLSTIFKPSQSY